MKLIDRYSGWFERFLLLFPNPTPDVQRKISGTTVTSFFRRGSQRDGGLDHSIPQAMDQAAS